ncbi:NAD(P)-dependent dehydrogenase (short-subunit alcohol dehydrogenase family) [Mycoplana sp. BE70]|uniref:SDR family NAD(P)-dependent oxidoreductase n=1 Tax=Mycoplana sp. BE70 TaxID=2817775 RepID=UPI0028547E27|nr:SDR family oxidoreductase [Mycoplana sp. BE70]MDR6757109.1 NAD(P)-dependent dehydrogenase (short-subunit alcohol dehydrogenase family) [Mycoplana sp. BE70]
MTEDLRSLANRRALVTGAARGIGAAIAAELARRGAAVLLVDIDGPELDATTDSLSRGGARVHAFRGDVTAEAELAEMARTAQARLGGLDILVNNAAILDATPLDALTRSRYAEVQEINQNAALWTAKAMLPLLAASPHARIVNIASILGIRGTTDSLAYAIAKGGVVNMTRALAVDLAPKGVLVNCICPGFVDTRMAILPDGSGHEHEADWFRDVYIKYGRIPLRRPAPPEEIARATMFFCGDDCSYVTGQILLVDGGISATF